MDYSKFSKVPSSTNVTENKKTEPQVLGLEFLATLKAAERIEYTIPFPVRMKFTPVRVDGKIVDIKDVRFYTSDLQDASFEVKPVFKPGTMVDVCSGDVGTLVVSCAKQKSMFNAVVDEVTGYTSYSFKATVEFVSFNGKKAVKFAEAEERKLNVLKLLEALNKKA